VASKPEGVRDVQISGWRWFLGHVFELVRQFGNSVIWAAVVCFFVWEAGHALMAFAGRTSIANLALAVAAKVQATIMLSLAATGTTTFLWLNEARRHKNTRQRLTQRTEELEKRLDLNRESSQLTRRGTTREEDQ
jgi:membrane protein implicated in regulation of membrane protease activity